VVETLQATIIRHNQAIRLRARKECLDRQGTRRVTGSALGIVSSHPNGPWDHLFPPLGSSHLTLMMGGIVPSHPNDSWDNPIRP